MLTPQIVDAAMASRNKTAKCMTDEETHAFVVDIFTKLGLVNPQLVHTDEILYKQAEIMRDALEIHSAHGSQIATNALNWCDSLMPTDPHDLINDILLFMESPPTGTDKFKEHQLQRRMRAFLKGFKHGMQ